MLLLFLTRSLYLNEPSESRSVIRFSDFNRVKILIFDFEQNVNKFKWFFFIFQKWNAIKVHTNKNLICQVYIVIVRFYYKGMPFGNKRSKLTKIVQNRIIIQDQKKNIYNNNNFGQVIVQYPWVLYTFIEKYNH